MTDSFSLVKIKSIDCIERRLCLDLLWNDLEDHVEVFYSEKTSTVCIAVNLEQNENFISTDYYALQHPTKPVAEYTIRDSLNANFKRPFKIVYFECKEHPDITLDAYLDMHVIGAPYAVINLHISYIGAVEQ